MADEQEATAAVTTFLQEQIDNGATVKDAAAAAVEFAISKKYLPAIARTITLQGFVRTAHKLYSEARRPYTRMRDEDWGDVGITYNPVPAEVQDPSPPANLTKPVSIDSRQNYMDMRYMVSGVQVLVRDMTHDDWGEVRGEYLQQAMGMLRHLAFTNTLYKRTVGAGEQKTSEVLTAQEVSALGRECFTTDKLAQLWMKVSDAENGGGRKRA